MGNQGVFITGIGTDVGKTIVSAILSEAWHADYYKPIQAGNLDHPDSSSVKALITNDKSIIHPSSFNLSTPASPHYAASLEQKELATSQFFLPASPNPLIVEGAGGIMVPISQNETMLDLIKYLALPVILVSSNYLGAINHTLLSVEMLKKYTVPILGIIYNGGPRSENQSIIEHMSQIPTLGVIPQLASINKETISNEAVKFVALNPFH